MPAAAGGIGERNSAGNNRWTQISTHDNGGLGIDKFASSDSSNIVDLPFPVVISAALAVSTVSVYGRADPTMYIDASSHATVTVELYTVATNRSGYGEGRNYLGSAVTDGSGNWQVDFPETIIGCYTAFETIPWRGRDRAAGLLDGVWPEHLPRHAAADDALAFAGFVTSARGAPFQVYLSRRPKRVR